MTHLPWQETASQSVSNWITDLGKNPYSLVRYLGTSKTCLEINAHHQVGKWDFFASLLCEHGNSPPYPDGSQGNTEQNHLSFWDQGPTEVNSLFRCAWSSPISVSISPSLNAFLEEPQEKRVAFRQIPHRSCAPVTTGGTCWWCHPAQDTLPMSLLIPGRH